MHCLIAEMIGDVRDVVALIINQQLKNPKNPTTTTITTQGRQSQLTKLLSYARWTVKNNNNGNCKWIITNLSRSWSGFWGFEYRDRCSRLRLSLNSNRFGARRNWQIGLTTGPETRLQLQPFNTLSEESPTPYPLGFKNVHCSLCSRVWLDWLQHNVTSSQSHFDGSIFGYPVQGCHFPTNNSGKNCIIETFHYFLFLFFFFVLATVSRNFWPLSQFG